MCHKIFETGANTEDIVFLFLSEKESCSQPRLASNLVCSHPSPSAEPPATTCRVPRQQDVTAHPGFFGGASNRPRPRARARTGQALYYLSYVISLWTCIHYVLFLFPEWLYSVQCFRLETDNVFLYLFTYLCVLPEIKSRASQNAKQVLSLGHTPSPRNNTF